MVRSSFRFVLAGLALAGLAGCGQEAAKEEYKADVVDQSGGQIIVEDAGPQPQGVKVPDTPMTPVPDATQTAAPAE